jgi:hypothetical protein
MVGENVVEKENPAVRCMRWPEMEVDASLKM